MLYFENFILNFSGGLIKKKKNFNGDKIKNKK